MLPRAALLILLSFGFVRLAAADRDELNLLRAKAERGNALAQYNLGLVYVQGRIIPADPAEAFAWLSLASESGATGKALDSLLGNITDQQLAEGRRRLTVYRAALASAAGPSSLHPAPKLAPRGFTLEAPPTTPPPAESNTPLTRAPEPVVPPVATSPGDGSSSSALAQAKRELEKTRTELLAANAELATLRANQTRLEAAATEAKAAASRLNEELAAARRELAAFKPSPALSPAEKSKAEDLATHRP